MLKHNFQKSNTTPKALVPERTPFLLCGTASFAKSDHNKNVYTRRKSTKFHVLRGGRRASSGGVKAIFTSTQKTTSVKVVVTVLETLGGVAERMTDITGTLADRFTDLQGRSLSIELIAAELDHETGDEKTPVQSYARNKGKDKDGIYYEASFKVPADFGEVGAILIENEHHTEMYVKNIVLNGYLHPINFSIDSWVQSKHDRPGKRIFFTDKSYLPSETPSGIKRYREEELETLRGDGEGERKNIDRIYDYDVYNDLGDPDKDEDLARPVLGGAKHPYPRRCRTGRPRTKKDNLSESRSSYVYVPRDEAFSEVKNMTFNFNAFYSVLKSIIPSMETSITKDERFPHFTAIETLFNEGLELEDVPDALWEDVFHKLATIASGTSKVLRFETPELIDRDRFSWFRDAEFGRQALAGINPLSIKLVTEWPMKSNLDPEIYGPAESAITRELVEEEIRGFCTLDEALEQKLLFVLDYHDLYLPYVHKVRKLPRTTLYGSRSLFMLMPTGTLRPLAIELTRPPSDDEPLWRHVFKPSWDATAIWLWRLAKVHVLAHDSGHHQLISHWLRTHCCMEPYIIATHRHLSVMHPIYRLLHPHFRYTMEINALAREALINAGGVIESGFSPGKYAIELSSVGYDKLWRFDLEALPADLINRGLAVEDPDAPHGIKLIIEDYPYANDGLLLWDAIKSWVTDYVGHYYPEAKLVESDEELQAWWTEIKTVGHGDKKDEPWWPQLKTQEDLIGILNIMIWVPSGHHAAVNFGQFDFGGYFPNRPTIARTNVPIEDPKYGEKEQFMERPEEFLLNCFPTQGQATQIMAILSVLSNHSPDEEYIGDKIEPYWQDDQFVSAAFQRFNGRLREIEGIIDDRNIKEELMNRTGAGVMPYELLRPFSEKFGVTGKGVPNSVSI